ncbi:hypothetical protein ABK040_008056 [Willaertia magna]
MDGLLKQLEQEETLRERTNNKNIDNTMQEIKNKKDIQDESNLLCIAIFIGLENALKLKDLSNEYTFWKNKTLPIQKDLEYFYNFSKTATKSFGKFGIRRNELRNKVKAASTEFIAEHYQKTIFGIEERKPTKEKINPKQSKKKENITLTDEKLEAKKDSFTEDKVLSQNIEDKKEEID